MECATLTLEDLCITLSIEFKKGVIFTLSYRKKASNVKVVFNENTSGKGKNLGGSLFKEMNSGED